MTLKEYIVVKTPESEFEVWARKTYQNYIKGAVSVGAGSAYRIITTFNADEQLQEQKGLRWVRASERVPDHYRSVHARWTRDGNLCKWTIRYNPSTGDWITQGAEQIVEATDLEWLDEEAEPGQPVPAGEEQLREALKWMQKMGLIDLVYSIEDTVYEYCASQKSLQTPPSPKQEDNQ